MVIGAPDVGRHMSFEVTAVCDGCGVRRTFRVNAFGKKFTDRPRPGGWTHVHRGRVPGTVTPEIGIACSRSCLSKARRALLACRVR
jgi:hypothetical protein